jgi:hypothetical protein
MFMRRVGRILALLKKHVDGRKDSAFIPFQSLVLGSGEPEGFLFNIIDSRASTTLNSGRIGAKWHDNQKGRLVFIPVDFNLEPTDIASSLTAEHLRKIEELEEDRAQFHCPHCDSRMIGGGQQDFPEYHCIVTYEEYACGMVTADGEEDHPCPFGPNWPTPEEFDLRSENHGTFWTCYCHPKTARARTISGIQEYGDTREEAESKARAAVAPKKKGPLR